MNWTRLFAIVLCAALLSGEAAAQGNALRVGIGFGENPRPVRPTAPINDLQGMSAALQRCWRPPPIDQANGPVDVGFHISFKRSGELFGKPRTVMFSRDLTPERRDLYHLAVAEALDLCSALPFTDSMGGAVAGRVLRIQLIDMRNKRQVLLHD